MSLFIDTSDNAKDKTPTNIQSDSPLTIDSNNDEYTLCIPDSISLHHAQDAIDEVTHKQVEQCVETCEGKKSITGSSGTICEVGEIGKEKYLKISNMPTIMIENLLSKQLPCSTVMDNISTFENENKNSAMYAELKKQFPDNIMDVYETSQCTDDNTNYYYNHQYIEKIEGITLKEYIKTASESLIVKIMFQLFYILIYANMHGYYHNDIKFNNLILKNNTEETIIHNQIIINNHTINLEIKNMNYTPVFIDFSNSVFINQTEINQYNIIEAVMILDKFKPHISNIQLRKLIETIIKETQYGIMLTDELSGRLMSHDTLTTEFELVNSTKIFSLFQEINKFLEQNDLGIKCKIVRNSLEGGSDNCYHKYLKYKCKYINLKKNLAELKHETSLKID